MGNVSVSLPADGSGATTPQYNTPMTTLVNEFNGNIDNTNIKAGAAIATNKLADDAGITDAKMSGVSSSKLSNPYKFRAHPTSNQTGVTGVPTTVILGTEDYDTGNNFASNTFTAPVSGFYQINAIINFGSTPGLYTGCAVQLLKNGVTAIPGTAIYDNNSSIDFLSGSYNDCIQLTAGDTLVLQGQPLLVSGTGNFATTSFFSAFLVSIT